MSLHLCSIKGILSFVKNQPKYPMIAPQFLHIHFGVITLGFLAVVRVALVGTLVLVLLSTVLVDKVGRAS
jgi:hypothetical protein